MYRNESTFQASFAALHAYAAALAVIAAVLHLSAALYHSRRWKAELAHTHAAGAGGRVTPIRPVRTLRALGRRAA